MTGIAFVLRAWLGLALLLLCANSAAAQEWEDPREVYSGWSCGRMEYDNATYDICKRCEETGGRFLWQVPPGITMLDSKARDYVGRCEEKQDEDDTADAPEEAPDAPDESTSTQSSSAEPDDCADGTLKCPDGQCYAIDNVNSCCSAISGGGACSAGNICWSFVPGSLCCRIGEQPTESGCVNPSTGLKFIRRPVGSTASEASSPPAEDEPKPPEPRQTSRFTKLIVCNDASEKIWFSLGRWAKPDDQHYKFEGWWRVEPRACKGPFTFMKGDYFIYGYSATREWQGESRFCIRTRNFEYFRDGVGSCSETSKLFRRRMASEDETRITFSE